MNSSNLARSQTRTVPMVGERGTKNEREKPVVRRSSWEFGPTQGFHVLRAARSSGKRGMEVLPCLCTGLAGLSLAGTGWIGLR